MTNANDQPNTRFRDDVRGEANRYGDKEKNAGNTTHMKNKKEKTKNITGNTTDVIKEER